MLVHSWYPREKVTPCWIRPKVHLNQQPGASRHPPQQGNEAMALPGSSSSATDAKRDALYLGMEALFLATLRISDSSCRIWWKHLRGPASCLASHKLPRQGVNASSHHPTLCHQQLMVRAMTTAISKPLTPSVNPPNTLLKPSAPVAATTSCGYEFHKLIMHCTKRQQLLVCPESTAAQSCDAQLSHCPSHQQSRLTSKPATR